MALFITLFTLVSLQGKANGILEYSPQIVNMYLRKVTIYLLTSCNTEERIAQNIYIHNSNRIYNLSYSISFLANW